MEVKNIELEDGLLINVIPSKEFAFMIPVSALAETLGYKTTVLSNIAKTKAYEDNIYVATYQGNDTPFYRRLKKGGLMLTRLGVVALCIQLRTTQSKIVSDWASIQTYDKLVSTDKIAQLFKDILEDANRITSPPLKKRMLEQINELKMLV